MDKRISRAYRLNREMGHNIGVIGGTDSSRGSGLRADEQTIFDLQCNAFCVISAITIQNPSSPPRIHPIPPVALKSQLNSLAEQPLDAVKIGMLPDAHSVEEVALFLEKIDCDRVILDPVQKTSLGYDLISSNGWISLVKDLLPNVDLITPNFEEALCLLGLNHSAELKPQELIVKCAELGAKSVLLKGGHLPESRLVTDILLSHNNPQKNYNYQRLRGGTEVRGTGCRLASAIACEWTRHKVLEKAVESAGDYIQAYIKQNLP